MSEASSPEGEAAGPWLTVHALSEFVFCPRAGLLTVETRADDADQQLRANLDFSLPYSVKELEQALNRHFNRLWLLGGVTGLLLIGAAIAFWTGRELFMLFAAGPLLLVAGPLSRRVTAVQQLIHLRRRVLASQPLEMDFTARSSQEVSWWELLADGWTSVPCHEAYRDEALGIGGSPWRTLRRASQTIPVFKMSHINAEGGPRIFPQHVVRMAGYCHLIETCEGSDSPAGIVLFGNSYQGVTVPNSPEAKDALQRAIQTSRDLLVQVRDGRPDPPPPPPAFCFGCPWGELRRYRQDYTEIAREGEIVPVFGSATPDGQLYHSACGDRFEWISPHESAVRLRLT